MRRSRKKNAPAAANGEMREEQQQHQHQHQQRNVTPHIPPQVPHQAQVVEKQPPPELNRLRRKQTNDELASLTSKNYRLAKELSELRVRHRDECKSVSRLTMENMNLASRCREAISHVAMLKKELAMHQQRAAEALAMQREQTQRLASNLSNEMSRLSQSGSDSSEDGDRSGMDLERIMSPGRTTSSPSSKQRSQSAENLVNRHSRSSDLDEDDTIVDTVTSSSPAADNENGVAKEKDEESPKVFSTPNKNRNPDRWKPKMDQDSDSPGMFPNSASPTIAHNKSPMYNEEFPPDMITDPHKKTRKGDAKDDLSESYSSGSGSSTTRNALQGRSIISMNSINAFEASFDTKFPAEFPSKGESDRKNSSRAGNSNSTEIYNPFSPSPARSIENGEIRNSSVSSSRSPYTQVSASPNESPIHPTIASSPTVIRTARLSDPGVFGSAPVTPDEKKSSDSPTWSEDSYHTPTKAVRSVQSSGSVEPKRPEKTVSSAARARYEKAMQPRTSSSSITPNGTHVNEVPVDTKPEPQSEKNHGFLKGSPSALLKRIQQRRVNKQQSRQESGPETQSDYFDNEVPRPLHERQQSEPQATSHSVGSSDIEKPAGMSNGGLGHEPFDENEAIPPTSATTQDGEMSANRSSPGRSLSSRLNAMRSRRGVKQPISYAEPSLNSKLRSGDEFFPKADNNIRPDQVSHAGPVAG